MYDKDFQLQLLSLFVRDAVFSLQVIQIIQPSFFAHDLGIVYERIQHFIQTYMTIPTKASLKHICIEPELSSVVDQLFLQDKSQDEFIKKEAITFIRKSTLKVMLTDAVNMLQQEEEVEAILTRIRQGITVSELPTIGRCLYDDIDLRAVFRKEDLGEPIATLWFGVDQHLGGGVFPKTLNTLLAATNVGKSALLVNIGAAAVAQNKRVFHYTCEMSESRILDRYDARLTGYTIQELYNEDPTLIIGKLKRVHKMFGGEVIVKEYPPSTATVNDLRAHIEHTRIHLGILPDIIIVDYGDILKHINAKEFRHQLATTFIELRKMAVEYCVPVWTATQTNRGAVTKETVDIDDVSEDFEKIRISDNVIALCQTQQERESNQMRLFGAKVRDGVKGWSIPLHVDFTRMTVTESKQN